jgi:Zn-dependent protease
MFGLTPARLLGRLIVIFLGIPIHEWAHGWMAYVLGDETPEIQGRLTLNPFVHLDPIGTLMILFTGYGWGRSAKVNPYRMSRVGSARTGMALSALAGPMSNIIQAVFFALPIRLGLLDRLPAAQAERLGQVLIAVIGVNISLAVFNMIPIPPLDGSKVLAGVAPAPIADALERAEPYAPMLLMLLIFVLPQLGFDLIGILTRPALMFLIRFLIG